ncbi:hypothetical protein CVS40_11989 [Lucilia cuprina]|nr:hypothetical protein CVS40_11989 [Lucilia cuprina]
MFKIFLLLLFCTQVMWAAKPPNNYVGIVLNDIYTENFIKDIVTLLDVHFVTFQGRKAISGFFQYNQVIPNMYMKFTLNFEKPDKTRFEVLDLMIDVCSFLNGTYNRLKIPKLVFTELSKQKGFPKKCPIEANVTYTLENYEFEVPQFPLPNLKFIAAVTLYKSDKKHKLLVDIALHDLETEVYLKDILPHIDVHLVQHHGRKLINGNFTFAQTIRKLPLQFALNFEKPDKKQLHAMEFKADACEILKGALNKQTIPKLALKELNKQSRFPQKCPIEKNKTYGLDNFEFNSQHFPLPNLKFQVVFTLFTADSKQKILDVRVKGATRRYRNYI